MPRVLPPRLIGTEEQRELQARGYAPRRMSKTVRKLGYEQIRGGRLEQVEPVAEQGRRDTGHVSMGCDWIALIATAGQHHG